jgi:hypothetical protein
MPIEKIKFEKLFPTVQYGNELFSMEGTVGPNETKESLYDEMHDLAVNRFYRNNPHLQSDISAPQPAEPKELPIKQVEKDADFEPIPTLVAIASCKSPAVLKIYRKQLKTRAEEIAYEEKMQELMSQKVG